MLLQKFIAESKLKFGPALICSDINVCLENCRFYFYLYSKKYVYIIFRKIFLCRL